MLMSLGLKESVFEPQLHHLRIFFPEAEVGHNGDSCHQVVVLEIPLNGSDVPVWP